MKPLNLDNRPCSPISSNCIIWQGPDIPCIKLCTGDTISDVVFKLATELCTIMDTLDIKNYDLSCFNLAACPPTDFQALIQFLIEQICSTQGIDTKTATVASGCPDCPVTVAPCFVTNGQTTMQLIDYVQMIGTRLCNIVSEIALINEQITNILVRLDALEDAPPPVFTLPVVNVSCDLGASVYTSPGTTVNPSVSRTIDIVLDALINDSTNGYCVYTGLLGTIDDLQTAISRKCITDSTLQLTNGLAFSTNAFWVQDANYSTVADAINNLWVVLCDVFDTVANFNPTGGSTSSTTVDITAGLITTTVNDTGWVDLNGFAWYGPYNIAANRVPQCRRIGNVIHFRGIIMIPLQDPSNGNQPLIWDYKGTSPLTDTYFTNATVTPSQAGAGSVVLSNGGSLTFNQGLSVIPTSVIDTGTLLDNTYSLGFKLAIRPVRIKVSPLYSGALNSLLNISVTSDKKLIIQLIKDLEETAGTGGTPGNPYSTSIANNVISHVRAGEYVPRFQNSASVMASSPNSGTVDTTALPAPLGPDTQYINNTTIYYDSSLTYAFDCDANDETNIGGFGWIPLDGLIAYLDPCTTDIKVSIPC